MSLLVLIIIATIGYTFFQFFSAKAGGKIDGGLVPVVVNIFAVLIPLTFLLVKVFNKSQFLHTQRIGLFYAILAGVSIAVFAMAFQKIFQQGGNLSYVSPLIFGGAIALSTILSVIFLKESVTRLHLAGIFLVASGLCLISFARA